MLKPVLLASLAAVAMGLLSTGSPAAEFVIRGAYIKKVMVNGGPEGTNFGGCMANLTLPVTKPATVWPAACVPMGTLANDPWVTFSCTGSLATNTVQAYRLLDQAQLALAANKKVDVYYTDDANDAHNGYCFAYRLDVIR